MQCGHDHDAQQFVAAETLVRDSESWRRVLQLGLEAASPSGALCSITMRPFSIFVFQSFCVVLQPFESESECYKFLQELVNTGECELFLITKEDTGKAPQTE